MAGSTSNPASPTVTGEPARPEGCQADQPASKPKADYRSLVAQLIDPVVIVNRIGRIGFMNPAAHQWLRNGLAVRLEGYLNTERGKRTAGKVRFKLDDGTKISLEVARRDITWAGKPAVLVALHDISRHVRATQRTRNSHLRKLSLLGQVPVATYVVALDDGAGPPFLSRQFEDLLGRPRESWQGNAELWRQFVHDDDYERVVQDLTQAIKDERPFEAEYRMTTESGEVIRVREQARVLKDKLTNQSFLSGFLLDITNKTQAQQQLSSARRELEGIQERHSQELEKAREQVQRELAEARQAVKESSAERAGLEGRVNESAAELQKAEEQARLQIVEIQRQQSENEELQREVAEAKRQTERFRAGRDHLEMQLSERSAELVTAETRLQDQIRLRERAEEEDRKLRQRLAAAKEAERILAAYQDRLEKWAKAGAAELQTAAQQLHEVIGSNRGGNGKPGAGA